MSKRARYVGPFDKVDVYDPQADVYAPPVDTVVHRGLLSADVPARIRDDLLQTADWEEAPDPRENKPADKPKDGEQ